MTYARYNPATGEILYYSNCPEEPCVAVVPGLRHPVVRDGVMVEGPPPADAYAALRSEQYPPLEDQLDALWKGGEAAAAMRERVMAVKRRFPKPHGGG